jgi:hypothetical protein
MNAAILCRITFLEIGAMLIESLPTVVEILCILVKTQLIAQCVCGKGRNPLQTVTCMHAMNLTLGNCLIDENLVKHLVRVNTLTLLFVLLSCNI